MMDDGGPAFPRPRSEGNLEVYDAQDGMSLRDYFAAQVLAALVGSQHYALGQQNEEGRDGLAFYAYATADAMLKARKDGNT